MRSTSDYSGFGVQLDGRTANSSEYRYGYQGSEKDDEIKGEGNSYTTHYRQLDPRVGRWMSIDPKSGSLPWQSSYCSMDNNPILFNDVLGDSIRNYTKNASSKSAITSLLSTKKGYAEIAKYAAAGDELFGFKFEKDGKYSKKNIDLNITESNAGFDYQQQTKYYLNKDRLTVHIDINTNLLANAGGPELDQSNRTNYLSDDPNKLEEHRRIWATYISFKAQSMYHELKVHAEGDIRMWENGSSTEKMETNDDHANFGNAWNRGSITRNETPNKIVLRVVNANDPTTEYWMEGYKIAKEIHRTNRTNATDKEILKHQANGLIELKFKY
jgi:RHS repeat-associated protein